MVKIKILYGSSCVGKSHIMNIMYTMDNSLFKIEIDDCEYWKYPENERTDLCINYFVNKIKENKKQDIIATCGHLPLPDNEIYNKIEKEFNLEIEHTLVLNKDINEYKEKIIKRQRQSIMNQLIKDYHWRESGKCKYDTIIYN